MIRLFIQLLVASSLFIGCGGSSEPESKPKADIQNPQDSDDSQNQKIRNLAVNSFTINTKNILSEDSNSTGINNFHVNIKRGESVIYDNLSKQNGVKLVLNKDGSISFSGLDDIKKGDVVTFLADGFTPQQQVIDEMVVETRSLSLALKPIDSRQTFTLGNLDSGRVTTRFKVGANSKENGEKIEFKTDNGNVQLSFDSDAITSLLQKVKRSPKADKNTEIYLDITSIDPKTELESTIGDFTYSPSFEPRSTKAVNASETMLESVVMSSITMSTSEGDEIHCFDGSSFDEDKEECTGSAKATLKMKIPASQFDEYARKYNKGDRVVPLYHYSSSKSTWVRQVDSDKNPIDAELVLEDNDNDKTASEGDILYLEGKVGHFSYWNGDYPRETTCLQGVVSLEGGADSLPNGTMVVSKGSDYYGRSFRQSISSEDLSFDNLRAKADAKVELFLKYPNGAKSSSIFVQSGKNSRSSCQDVGELVSKYKSVKTTIKVVDENSNVLEGAIIKVNGVSKTTNKDGVAEVSISSEGHTTISASYDTGEFVTTASKNIDSEDTIILDTRAFTISGKISFKNTDNEVQKVKNAYVTIYSDSFYQKVFVKSDGSYTLTLPFGKVTKSMNLSIYSGVFVPLYAKYMNKEESITVESSDLSSKKLSHDIEFTLKPFIVSGRVINPFAKDKKNRGIAGVVVYTDNQSTKTDENGNYKLVLFYKKGGQKIYAYDSQSYEYAKPYPIKIDEDQQDEDLSDQDFVIDKREAIITGTIINNKAIPVKGIEIYTNYGWVKQLSDDNGKFTFHISDPSLINRSNLSLIASEGNKKLASKRVNQSLKRGKSIDVGEIIVNNNLAPVIESVSFDTPIVDQPLVISVDAYDPENDNIKTYITFDADDYDVVNGEVSITPAKAGSISFTTTVEEIDTDDKYKSVSIQKVIVLENAKPKVESIEGFNKSFNKDSDMKIKIDAYDPEGSDLNFGAKLYSYFGWEIQKYLEIDENEITISKDIPNGTYRLKVSISDGENSIEREFNFYANSNKAPTNLTLKTNAKDINKTLRVKESDGEITIVASADDDDSLKYSWKFNEALGSASKNEFKFNPNGKVGIYEVAVSVSDSKESISKTIEIIISNNFKPVVDEILISPKEIIKSGDNFTDSDGNIVDSITVRVNAHDPENKELTYEFDENIKSSLLSTKAVGDKAKNIKTYKLKNLKAGRYSINVKIKDSDGKETQKRKIFEIKENKPPLIKSFFVPVVTKVDKNVNLKVNAIDPEGKDLSYKWSAKNGDVDLDITDETSNTAVLEVGNISGSIEVKLEVSDGSSSVVRERKITVSENQTPIISQFRVLPTSLKVGKSVSFSVEAYDKDNDELSYEWFFNKKLISSNISDTFKVEEAGKYEIKVVVTDGDKSVESSENITVLPLAAKPVVKLSATHTDALVGSMVKIDAVVDVAGEYKIRWIGDEISSENIFGAEFIGNEVGSYKISVIATNEDGIESDEVSIVINVKDVVATISTLNNVLTLGNEFKFNTSLSDEGTVPADAKWEVIQKPANSTATISANGASAVFTPDVVGSYTIQTTFVLDSIAGGEFKATSIITAKDEDQDGEDVSGVIKDDNGEILSGAKLRLYNSDNSELYDETTTTLDDGSYIFENVPSGNYYLVVSGGNGYINQTQTIKIQ